MAGEVEATEQAKIKRLGNRAYWVGEVQSALKREKDYRKMAQEVVDVYEGSKNIPATGETAYDHKSTTFNILYSNTETLMPALYNSTPRPVVQRRFKDADPLGLVAARAAQRVLSFLMDAGDQEYSPFDQVMEQAVLEGTVPGRGVTWVKYDVDFEALPQGEGERAEGEVAPDQPTERVKYETVCFEEVSWDRFICAYGRKWKDLGWVGREHLMTAEELIENFGDEKAKQMQLVNPLSQSSRPGGGTKSNENDAVGAAEVAFVYEIWDKVRKKVVFVSEQYEDGLLKEVDDPLELTGFFPCARPLQFIAKVSDMVPIPLYQMYRSQAEELNSITVRLKWLIQACKVRGFYNASIQEIENVLTAEDNTLLPAANVAALDGKTLDSQIWLVPIDMIIGVVQALYQQREQVKQVIYEITGIADIMRGSSNAAETAEAQGIKNQWGTLRLKRMQRRVMGYARDLLRIAAEVSCKKFGEKTFAAMTGLPFPTTEQKAQAQQQLVQLQQQMPPPMPQQPGQPPQQEQPNPQMEQLQKVVGQPSWGDILKVLRSDLLRNYKIDIETNSTIDLDATEDKQEIAEFLNAMAQLLNGMTPAVQNGLFTEDVAKQLVMTVLRRFRFMDEVEEELAQAGGQQQQKQDPAAQAAQAKAQADMQKAQMQMQVDKQHMELEGQKIQMEQQTMQMKADFERQEHQLKMQELSMKAMAQQAKHDQQMAATAAKEKAAAAKPTTATG